MQGPSKKCPKCGGDMEPCELSFCAGLLVMPEGCGRGFKGWICPSCGFLEAE